MIGDSAGREIILGSVLKMRDSGIGMPAAVVVFYPSTDLTLKGDTVFTLKDADPILNVTAVEDMMAAYGSIEQNSIALQFMVISVKDFLLR